MFNQNKILVTGGNGFIGSHLVDYLINKNFSVISVDNLSGSNYGKLLNVNNQAKYYYGDVGEITFLDNVLKSENIHTIFHLAANANVPFSDQYPALDFKYNAQATFNVLNLAIKYNIKKVIFASSAAIYGNPRYNPIDEKHDLNPVSNYGVTKLYGEKLGLAYFKTYGLNFTSMRIFNTYGPRQPRYVLYDFINKLNRNSKYLEILGDGEQKRTYSFVEDTVRALYLAFKSDNSNGNVYNVAGEEVISITELARIICESLNINPEFLYTGKSWKGDIKVLTGSIKKIKSELGFEPKFSIREGIKKSIDWFKKNGYI